MNKGMFEKFIAEVIRLSDADETEVTVNGSRTALTRFSGNQITQNVESTDYPFTIRLVYSGKVGRVSGASLKKESIKGYLAAAKEIALHQNRKPGLRKPLSMQKAYRETDGFVSSAQAVEPDRRAVNVKKCISMCEKKKLEAAGILSNSMNIFAIGNSKGLFAFNKGTSGRFSVTAMSKNSSGWGEQISNNFNELDIEGRTETAINKAIRSKNPQKAAPGKYTVILEPAAVADLVSFAAYAVFNTRNYIEGRSYLSGKKIGEKMVSKNITLRDDAYMKGTMGIPFDFEGYPRKEVTLIENGILKGLVGDRYTEKAGKIKNTGHSLGTDDNWGPIPLNLVIMPGKSNVDEMIKSTEKGILVTHFHYVNMLDPMKTTITGMTRNGIFLVEKGKISKGLKNFRFTQSIIEALSNVEMIGSELELHSGGFWGGYMVPSMKIKNFNFSSITDF